MGIIELNKENGTVTLYAKLLFYGSAANEQLAVEIGESINRQWNLPEAVLEIQEKIYKFKMSVQAVFKPGIKPQEIFENDDPRINYFRIEEHAHGNISYVDGLGSNTGYFQLDNLITGSTTAAHEFGHTLGLPHPHIIDIRGKGIPGIMYPRGTITDVEFQYDPNATAGAIGGTMNPIHRRVSQQDINDLKINKLNFNADGIAVIGEFSSVWHEVELQR